LMMPPLPPLRYFDIDAYWRLLMIIFAPLLLIYLLILLLILILRWCHWYCYCHYAIIDSHDAPLFIAIIDYWYWCHFDARHYADYITPLLRHYLRHFIDDIDDYIFHFHYIADIIITLTLFHYWCHWLLPLHYIID
jgi:hypothetical protein